MTLHKLIAPSAKVSDATDRDMGDIDYDMGPAEPLDNPDQMPLSEIIAEVNSARESQGLCLIDKMSSLQRLSELWEVRLLDLKKGLSDLGLFAGKEPTAEAFAAKLCVALPGKEEFGSGTFYLWDGKSLRPMIDKAGLIGSKKDHPIIWNKGRVREMGMKMFIPFEEKDLAKKIIGRSIQWHNDERVWKCPRNRRTIAISEKHGWVLPRSLDRSMTVSSGIKAFPKQQREDSEAILTALNGYPDYNSSIRAWRIPCTIRHAAAALRLGLTNTKMVEMAGFDVDEVEDLANEIPATADVVFLREFAMKDFAMTRNPEDPAHCAEKSSGVSSPCP